MSFPFNHKTVFVLDRGPIFIKPCVSIDFDFHKSRAVGSYIPPAPIVKTTWTCAIEAVLEYCRIVWDIFPEDKLIRFIACDQEQRTLNSWDHDEQNSAFLSASMAKLECNRRQQKSSRGGSSALVREGLGKAVEAVALLTPQQRIVRSKSAISLVNRGRIICLTHIRDEQHLEDTVSTVKEFVKAANHSADEYGPSSKIDQVILDIIHCSLGSSPNEISSTVAPVEVTPEFSYQVYTVDAGHELAKKMLYLALCHYELASTTVTGIPMKEEQNASTSANYDVELFHQSSAHTRLLGDGSDLVQNVKDGCEYKTVTLKWCTPRGSTADLHHCTTAVRITPTDVNSRPSSCLTNFLLSGRIVMLEMPRRAGTKMLSHMLTSHSGQIFMHTLATSRSVLEDPPSISEGDGGRVTDYRINDLSEIMRENRMAPYYTAKSLDKSRQRLSRFTTFCPMTVGGTTIFNMAVLEPLQRLIVANDELTEDDVVECKKVIYALVSMESKSEMLPVPVITSASGKTKTMKKEDQYRTMFTELERFLVCHARTEKHVKVLDCLMEVRNKPQYDKSKLPLKQKGFSNEEKSDFSLTNDGVLRSTTDSPMSPTHNQPPQSKKARAMFTPGQSLLDIWTSKIQKENATKHVPFHGIRNLGEKAKLYLNFERAKDVEMVIDAK